MKKIWKRLLAYAIDMMVVMIIAQSLSGVPLFNRQLDEYHKHYQRYTKLVENYTGFKVSLSGDFKDKELTEKEYEKLIKDYPDYEEVIKDVYDDKKLSEKEYNSLIKKIDQEYQDDYREVYYQVEKYSITYFVVYLITVFAYFVGFNKITNGQTLGKKLMRLKVVSSKDSSEVVPIWSYVVRALLLYQPIYYIIKLIGVNTLGMNDYYNVTSIVYDIQYYLEFLIIIMVMIRMDGRGLHDLLARTRVVLFDKNGNEIEENLNPLVSKKLK